MSEIEQLKIRLSKLEAAHERLLLDVNREFKKLKNEYERERKRYKSDIQALERNIRKLSN